MCQKSSRLEALQAVSPPALRHNPQGRVVLATGSKLQVSFCLLLSGTWPKKAPLLPEHLPPRSFVRLKERGRFASPVGSKTGAEAAYSVLIRCWAPPRTAPSYKRLHSCPVRLFVGISYRSGHQICGAHSFITGRRVVLSLSENCPSLGKVF